MTILEDRPVITTVSALFDAVDVRKALAQVKPAIGRSQQPVLSGVKVDFTDEGMTLTTTNCDLTISTHVQGTTLGTASGVIPFADLAKFVKGKGTLEVGIDDEYATLSLGLARARLRLLPLDQYPLVRPVDTGTAFPLDVAALASVIPAACTDDSLPVISGVLFDVNKVVATDRYRLHVANTTAPACTEPVIVPRSACVVLVKHGGPFTARFSDKNAQRAEATFTSGALTVTTRLIEGEFPPYQKLIPAQSPRGITFDRALLEVAADMAKAAKGSNSPVVLHEGSPLRVTLNDLDVEREATVAGSSDLTIGLNPAFLADLLTGLPVTRLDCVDAMKPAMACCLDDEGREHIRLLMPVRVNS